MVGVCKKCQCLSKKSHGTGEKNCQQARGNKSSQPASRDYCFNAANAVHSDSMRESRFIILPLGAIIIIILKKYTYYTFTELYRWLGRFLPSPLRATYSSYTLFPPVHLLANKRWPVRFSLVLGKDRSTRLTFTVEQTGFFAMHRCSFAAENADPRRTIFYSIFFTQMLTSYRVQCVIRNLDWSHFLLRVR